VVLVVRLNLTTKEAGRRALRVMNNVDAPLEGVVLTDAGAAERSVYYTSSPVRTGGEPRSPRATGESGSD